MDQPDLPFFLAIHIGAGVHLQKNDGAKKKVMAEACLRGAEALRGKLSPMDACTAATVALEDSPLTNAGYGSALNEAGFVECDASIMSGAGAFGAVGACAGLKNPIEVARQIAIESQHPMPLHRVRPIFLAGDGAREWAHSHGLECAATQEDALKWNIAPAQKKSWKRYTEMIAAAPSARIGLQCAAQASDKLDQPIVGTKAKHVDNQTADTSQPSSPSSGTASSKARPRKRRKAEQAEDRSLSDAGLPAQEDEQHYDTVGCICVDSAGRCAASVSSGGLTMKSSGRIGEAAMFGCGCWANEIDKGLEEKQAVACSITGVGENIMRAGLARLICQDVSSDEQNMDGICRTILKSHIVDAELPVQDSPKDCGLILLHSTRGPDLLVNFLVALSSPSIGVAYYHSNLEAPVCKIERLAAYTDDPKQISVSGISVRL